MKGVAEYDFLSSGGGASGSSIIGSYLPACIQHRRATDNHVLLHGTRQWIWDLMGGGAKDVKLVRFTFISEGSEAEVLGQHLEKPLSSTIPVYYKKYIW